MPSFSLWSMDGVSLCGCPKLSEEQYVECPYKACKSVSAKEVITRSVSFFIILL